MHDVHHHDEVASTNDTLLALAQDGAPTGTVVIARRQTAGRGRQGRSWLTLPGEHLFMSILWRPPSGFDPARVTGITLAMGVAACDVLRGLGVDARLKWPNDLWIGERKVAGILSELHDQHAGLFVVIGLGLDVNADQVPAELASIATTLEMALGRRVDLPSLGEALVTAMRSECDAYAARGGPDVAAYAERCLTIGRRARVEGRVGRAVDIAPDGALLVTWDDSPEAAPDRVVAGDVDVLPPEAA
ncbi:MAG: biotin--[acetyl-CoA-carboxylase] ligase [Deltaproteobacteria bacterium]|nr:biotin--[acetyl-CoA-carboxylase] ligase [Deltaproteobacteria bacterium]